MPDHQQGAERALEQVAQLAGRAEELSAQLAVIVEQRNRMVAQASDLGASRADVARAARLTRGRVQQIVDEQRR